MITPFHIQLTGGFVVSLGILLLIFFKGDTFVMFIVVLGAILIALGYIWEAMIKERKKKAKEKIK